MALTAWIRPELRHKGEPIIGHLKTDSRLGRNFLIGQQGDRIDTVICGAGRNFSVLFGWLLRR
jgi:IS5 family transposase